MAQNYDTSNLKVLEGLEAVRVRPGMYIGGTGKSGLHHILWEIVDNAMDEAANGYCSDVEVTIYQDGSCSVRDYGRGIPVDIHKETGISGVELIFTKLHAGGKFNNDSYKYSGGLHGVGASVTNALSRWLEVEVYINGKAYRQRFHSPLKGNRILSGVPNGTLECLGKTDKKRGTFVRFMPDDRVFEDISFDYELIKRRIKQLAYLNKGITMTFTDQRTVDENGDYKVKSYCFPGGIADFVEHINAPKGGGLFPPIYYSMEQDNFEVNFAIQYNDSYVDASESFVNNIHTDDGGTHEIGFRSAFTKVMNEYARRRNLLKEKESNLIADDFREGMTFILAIRMQNPEFDGQTKARLGSTAARTTVEKVVFDALSSFFESKVNFPTGDKIIAKAKSACVAREESRKAKENARKKKSVLGASIIGKLANCSGKKPENNELFIVEGNSAGGSAKQGRDRGFQAILPLRGKPLNAEKNRESRLLANEEFATIINALGANFGKDFNIDNLKYYKVIILADADQDGGHITSILLTFFYRYMRRLIEDGRLYVGKPPLFKIEKKDFLRYAYSKEESDRYVAEAGKGCTVQRYKGLGEMNPEQLWDTTLNPETRTLIKVTIDDIAEAEDMISTFMGESIEPRKKYIFENCDFNRVDDFDKKVD